MPLALQQTLHTSAQVFLTAIIAPLGTIAVAAHSFAITAEGLCYMPSYGIADAATTLIGQAVGAKRKDMLKRLGWLTTLLGIAIMTATCVVMYFIAPVVIGFLSPVEEVRELAVRVLRLVLISEPFFAASIVVSGVLRGAEDTLVPMILNTISMWLIRIPICLWLAGSMGLFGVWIGLTVELTARGCMFLVRLSGKGWMKRALPQE